MHMRHAVEALRIPVVIEHAVELLKAAAGVCVPDVEEEGAPVAVPGARAGGRTGYTRL
jgi:hypothetical protein